MFTERCWKPGLLLLVCGLVLTFGIAPCPAADADAGFKAGVARVLITPSEPMWMSGYASRNKPAEGKVHDLWAKALAIQDPSGGKIVLVTTDLVGLTRGLTEDVAGQVQKKTGLPRERLMFGASHTHCGPVIRDNLTDMYDMPPEEAKKIPAYTEKLRGQLTDIVIKALEDLKPAKVSVGLGNAKFAVNRRQVTDKGV